ncbi:MAG: DMT family transporter [Peptococcales bacterium]
MSDKHQALSNGKTKGIILVLAASALWGISGAVAQYLFHQQEFSPEWVVVVRLLTSGSILLAFATFKEKICIWQIWKNKNDVITLLLFSILGVLAVQYTYFAAIKHSNAATATILQYLAPVLIFCYLSIRNKKLPSITEGLAVLLALLGTLLLVTRGNLKSLSISEWALFWGVASAFALAYYTLKPVQLLNRWGSSIITGWGMLLGGICFSFINPPWVFQGQWSFNSFLAIVFIIIFGTVITFHFYLESLRYNTATETSLLACAEPLAAALVAVVWLKVPFGLAEWVGTFCIIGTIIILTLTKNTNSTNIHKTTSDKEALLAKQ